MPENKDQNTGDRLIASMLQHLPENLPHKFKAAIAKKCALEAVLFTACVASSCDIHEGLDRTIYEINLHES